MRLRSTGLITKIVVKVFSTGPSFEGPVSFQAKITFGGDRFSPSKVLMQAFTSSSERVPE